jgi:hypothetical protein
MAEIRFDETKDMVRYWASLASGRHPPLRSDVSPRAIAKLLPRVFIISNEDGVWKFRLAGTELYALYGRELTGQSFSAVWGGHFASVSAGLDAAAAACLPLFVSSDAWSLEGVVEAETVILPLRSSVEHCSVDRFIGLQSFQQPRPWWFGSRSFVQASVTSTAIVGEKERAMLAQARGRNVPAIKFMELPASPLWVVETDLTARIQ